MNINNKRCERAKGVGVVRGKQAGELRIKKKTVKIKNKIKKNIEKKREREIEMYREIENSQKKKFVNE